MEIPVSGRVRFMQAADQVVGAFAAFVLAGGYAAVLLASGRAHRRSGLAFGPWMLAGGWFGLVLGTPLATRYLQMTGLS